MVGAVGDVYLVGHGRAGHVDTEVEAMYRKKERAFTLLELLLVILIIGILAAVAVERFVGVGERAKIRATEAQINAFKGALERYKLDMDKYPETEEGLELLVASPDDEDVAEKWHGPYIEKIPNDQWSNEFVYKCPGDVNEEAYDIISFGPDGEEGTEDDIRNYEEEEG